MSTIYTLFSTKQTKYTTAKLPAANRLQVELGRRRLTAFRWPLGFPEVHSTKPPGERGGLNEEEGLIFFVKKLKKKKDEHKDQSMNKLLL